MLGKSEPTEHEVYCEITGEPRFWDWTDGEGNSCQYALKGFKMTALFDGWEDNPYEARIRTIKELRFDLVSPEEEEMTVTVFSK